MPLGVGRGQNVGLRDFCHILTLLPPGVSVFHKHMSSPSFTFSVTQVLQHAGISSTYIYSSLDQAARKINVAKFQHKKVKVMIVTDLAARGIDIPLLDNVINYNFPAKSKLFVHRVGK